MTTVNRAVKEHIRQITDGERSKTIRFLVRLRVVGAIIFTAQIGYLAHEGKYPDAVATLPVFLAYCVIAVVIALVVERWPKALRYSSYSIGLLDLPTMFGASWLALQTIAAASPGEDPKDLLATLLPYVAMAIVITVLSLDYGAIVLSTVVAAAGGAWFTYELTKNWGTAFDPALANTLLGAMGLFTVSRIRALVEESRRKDFAGKYVLGDRIGSGGMAEVFAATYSPAGSFERRVAVKRVLPAYAKNEEFIALFRREAELGSQLAHPNLVQILDFGRHLDSWFIAMEYVDGLTLGDVIMRGERLPLPAALYVVSEVAEALTYLHEKRSPDGLTVGLVHRDLNPPNVLLSADGEVKVSDFGVARWTTGAQLTRTGTVRGKLSYMPPEYLSGSPPSTLGDLYSLGIMAHELITGHRLYGGMSEAEIAQSVLTKDVPPPSLQRAETPAAVDSLIKGLLERTPELRLSSARSVTRALRSLEGPFNPYPTGQAQLREIAARLKNAPPSATLLPPSQTDVTNTLATPPRSI